MEEQELIDNTLKELRDLELKVLNYRHEIKDSRKLVILNTYLLTTIHSVENEIKNIKD